jgi:hypothetical protein
VDPNVGSEDNSVYRSWELNQHRDHFVAWAMLETELSLLRKDDTSSWGNFLVYFSHSTTMLYPLRG